MRRLFWSGGVGGEDVYGNPPTDDYLESTGLQKTFGANSDLYGTYGSGANEIAHSVIKVTGNGGFAYHPYSLLLYRITVKGKRFIQLFALDRAMSPITESRKLE